MSLFTQKALLPIWALLITLILIDISMRLSSEHVNSDGNWQAETPQQNHMQRLSQTQAEQIISQINSVEAEPELVETVETEQTMSEAEQRAQQGDLNQLYAGDVRFRLMGLFAKNGHFAVLLRKEISTDTLQMIKVQVGDSLKNYKIANILANQLLLEADDGRQISLNLFKQNN